ncbi:MAG: peptide deformylase [Halobacteriovoraceae bacterium]|nr:peptide deformylase [Halobacteriovoraceae bacterium]
MGVRNILRLGDPVLRKKAEILSMEEINSRQTKELVDDMLQTMQSVGGIGLAAPQIGVSKRLAVISIPADNQRYHNAPETPLIVIINPRISILSEKKQGYWEGCLSIPGMRGFVERPRKIQVDFQDLKGEKQSLQLKGFLATVFQHELDHLDGVLYVDHLKSMDKFCFEAEFREYYDKQNKNEAG